MHDRSVSTLTRPAGALYFAIILCGISAELLLRGPLVTLGNAAATADAIRANAGAFRAAIAADIVMSLADAGLALLLFWLFRPVSPRLALAALVFRLIQSVMIAMNLMFLQAAWLLLSGAQDIAALPGAHAEALATLLLNLHAHGYDLGLVFFGINSLLTGALIWRSGLFPRWLGAGIALAGLVYLSGSGLRFFAPAWFTLFEPAYVIPMLAETAFCIALLLHRAPRSAPACPASGAATSSPAASPSSRSAPCSPGPTTGRRTWSTCWARRWSFPTGWASSSSSPWRPPGPWSWCGRWRTS